MISTLSTRSQLITALLALVLGVGCGKKEKAVPKTQVKAKAIPKTEPKGETKKPEPSGATAKKDEAIRWVSDPSDPNNVKIEAAIRAELKKPTGELTEADLDKVTKLDLDENQLTDVKGLEKLTQLKELNLRFNQLTDVKGLENLSPGRLYLSHNPALTKAQIAELQKALPKCKIEHNAKK